MVFFSVNHYPLLRGFQKFPVAFCNEQLVEFLRSAFSFSACGLGIINCCFSTRNVGESRKLSIKLKQVFVMSKICIAISCFNISSLKHMVFYIFPYKQQKKIPLPEACFLAFLSDTLLIHLCVFNCSLLFDY